MSASGVLILRQHLDQAAALQVARDVPLGAHQDAVTVERPGDGDAAVVGGQAAAHLHRLGDGMAAAAAAQAPDAVGLLALADADAVVPRQVARHLGRAATRQVVGRGAEEAPVRRQVDGDHARVGRRAEADADVEQVLGQRRRIDRELQLHLHRRVLLHEGRDQRRDVAATEAEGRVDPQQALRPFLGDAELLRQVVDARQDAARMLEVDLALGREAHPPRGAVDERGAQPRLHQRQVLADRRRADAELPARRAQAARAREDREEAEVGRLDDGGARGHRTARLLAAG